MAAGKDILSVKLVGDRELILKFQNMSDKVHGALLRTITQMSVDVRRAVQDKLLGPVLQHKSGALFQSIQREVTDTPSTVAARIFSTGDVKYAAVQEFGGSRTYEIVPNKKKALSWMGGGGRVFAMRVIHPPLKERSYMRSTLAEMADMIKERMTAAVREATR